MSEPVTIQSTDYWIKVVEMLQQNWALIEAIKPEGVCVYFISDTSGVFDQMSFADEIAAREAVEAAYWPPSRPKTFEYWAHAACILPMRSPVLKIDTHGGTMIKAPSVIATTAIPGLTSISGSRSRVSRLILNHHTKW